MPFQKGYHPLTEFKKGYKVSEKTKKRIGKARIGTYHTKETRRKMSETHLGKNLSEKHKRSLSEAATGRKHTKETKKKIGIANKGEKCYFWRGGISYEPYTTDWTKTLKKAIRERDHYVCQICYKNGWVVHHINYDKKDCNPNNLITLCRSCHGKTNKNRNYWINYFMNTKKYAEEINKETQIAGETEKLPVINIENKNEKI